MLLLLADFICDDDEFGLYALLLGFILSLELDWSKLVLLFNFFCCFGLIPYIFIELLSVL